MKKFTFFLASLLVAIGAMAKTTTIDVTKSITNEVVIAEGGVDEEAIKAELTNKKIISLEDPTTSIDTDQWYVLKNMGRGLYVSEETSSFIMRNTSNLDPTTPIIAIEKAGYLYKFIATSNENEYYIISGNGLYFTLTNGSSNVSTTPVAYTIAQIGENAGHFYGVMVSDGRVLNGNGEGQTLAGWGTDIPTSIGANNDYQFIPVTFEEATIINGVYNFTYNDEVIYTQEYYVEDGADFPDYTVTLPYGVTAADKPTDKVSAENATQTIKLTLGELPFTVSTLENDGSFGENMHWYTLKLREKDLTYNAASNQSASANVTTKTLANFYAFTGNPFDGYKLFNYVAGPSKIAWSATVNDSGTAIPFTELSQVTDNTDWMLFKNGDAWTLRREDVSNGYINDRGGALSYWTSTAAATDPGSKLTISEVTTEVLTEIVTSYKTATIATLDEWKELSVVFDADLIASAKAAVEAVEVSGMGTFAEIDSKLTDVTDAVAAKMFTFQTTATDTDRNGVWVSASTSAGKAIGADNQDYNAIWSLRHAGGTSFYLFNELNQVYMGAPSSNCPLTAEPTAAYTFEIIDATNNIVEMKCDGGTLHATNHNDNKLMNYDNNEAASRWYINTIDVASDIQDILDNITAEDYAEVPALGQYPTAAYNALVEARNTATTVGAVETAIAAFNASKNKPVYFITSANENGYSAGSAIYYDGEWKWKTANKYDKQMWMTIPAYTQENVPTVNAYDAAGTSYEICDYNTGTVMRGKSVQIVAIDGWDGAYNLQYNADATSTDAAQHAASSGKLVNWIPATSSSDLPSAWYVEYIGTSYDLSQLTDEQLTALDALQSTYKAKAFFGDMVEGTAVGQYSNIDEDAINNALTAAESILNSSLVALKGTEVATITAATEALNALEIPTLNMPIEGRYYRIKGAVAAELAGYYISGNTNADGGRIACVENGNDASTIYLYTDGKLVAYEKGHYIALSGSSYTFGDVNAASAITFAASTRVAGAYSIKSADKFLHYKVYNGTVELDRCSDYDAHTTHDWALEEVTTLPVTITDAGYATFYAPVEVSFDGIKAYYTTGETLEDKYIQMVELENVIPANEGAILEGAAGTYDLTINYEGTTTITDNKLKGTVARSLITKEGGAFYVLGKNAKGNVGLYNPVDGENEGQFYNAGHKAYMFIPASTQTIGYSFGFDWSGTTGIDNIEEATEESATEAIYDITGRKIKAITTPGLYIIGGKKVVVK